MSDSNKLKQKAERIFEQVVATGAEADLIVSEGKSLSLKAHQGELEKHQVSSSHIFGLRVLKDGKVGIAYSEDDAPASLASMTTQALSNMQFSEPDEHQRLLQNAVQLRTDDTIFYQPDDSTIEEKIDLTLALESHLATKPYIKNVPYNGVNANEGKRSVFSTAGLLAQSRSRSFSVNAYALAEKGDKNAMEGKGQFERQFKHLDKEILIDDVYAKCLSMLEGKPVPSKHYDVIFNKETQSSLFASFSGIFSGKWAKDGINPWRDQVGEVVADERLHVFDNPLLKESNRYKLFDAEGSETQSRALIDKGVFTTLLHNSVTARYYAIENTANAKRGVKSSLGVGIHQFEIAAGDSNNSALKAGEFIEITALTGMHSGKNVISGNFSFGASGYLCRDGERVQAIRGITVAGNFYTMLKEIVAIGDKQYWNWSKSALMPAIRFDALAISGE